MSRTVILDGTTTQPEEYTAIQLDGEESYGEGQEQDPGLDAEIQEQETTEVVLESAAFNSVASLDDVNLTDLENDSVLMYKSATKKWVATKHFESHSFEAGQY